MNTIILKDCKFLFSSHLPRHATSGLSVLIRDKCIADVDTYDSIYAQLKQEEKPDVVDCSNKIVMPGLVDAHNHLCNTHMNQCRAFPYDKKMGDINPYMLTVIHGPYGWLTDDSIYSISTASLVNAIKYGATTVSNCTILPDAAYRAMHDSKVRGILAPQMQTAIRMKADNLNWKDSLAKTEYCLKHYHRPNERMKVVVHTHDVFDCTDQFIREAYALSREYNTNFVTHFWEFESTVKRCEAAFSSEGGGFEHYQKLGILQDNTVLFHGSFLNENQIEYLASVGTSVIHNPDINSSNCGTCAYIPKMLQAGLNVGLGSDYGSLSVLAAMKLMLSLHKVMPRELRDIQYTEPFDCATMGGAQAYQMEHLIGSLEKGKRADIITFDLSRASQLMPMTQTVLELEPELLFFLFTRNCPGTPTCETLIDGTFVRKNGEFTYLDEEKIVAEGFAWCEKSLQDIRDARSENRYYAEILHDEYIRDEETPNSVYE